VILGMDGVGVAVRFYQKQKVEHITRLIGFSIIKSGVGLIR